MKPYFSHDEGARNDPKPARVKGYGNAADYDRMMAIGTNCHHIGKEIAADPALAQYNTEAFIMRAARWSYREYGFGVADLHGYLAHKLAQGNHPMRLYNTDVKLWNKIRRAVFLRDDFTCAYCGQRGGVLEADHVLAVSKGGNNDLSNLTTACQRCNRRKRDKTAEAFRGILANEQK